MCLAFLSLSLALGVSRLCVFAERKRKRQIRETRAHSANINFAPLLRLLLLFAAKIASASLDSSEGAR